MHELNLWRIGLSSQDLVEELLQIHSIFLEDKGKIHCAAVFTIGKLIIPYNAPPRVNQWVGEYQVMCGGIEADHGVDLWWGGQQVWFLLGNFED